MSTKGLILSRFDHKVHESVTKGCLKWIEKCFKWKMLFEYSALWDTLSAWTTWRESRCICIYLNHSWIYMFLYSLTIGVSLECQKVSWNCFVLEYYIYAYLIPQIYIFSVLSRQDTHEHRPKRDQLIKCSGDWSVSDQSFSPYSCATVLA